MLYIGLDVHSKWMTIEGFDPETGETCYLDRVSTERESLRETFRRLDGPLHGAMESGTNAWAVYRQIEGYFERLLVVDPTSVWGRDVRRGAKTDQRDAMGLAQKLARGQLEGLYVPDTRTQDRRTLARAKVNASQQVTMLVSQIGSQLRSWGVVVDCSLLSRKGEALIERTKGEMGPLSQQVLESWLEMLERAKAVERKLDEAIRKEAEGDENCRMLMSIPGVGAFTAVIVSAEIGDIRRFPSPVHLISYCGLAPRVSASADKVYYGKVSKFCNKFLRYALVLRAQGVARLRADAPFRRTYWRVTIRNHRNDAKMAVARQIARIIYSMLSNRQYWDPKRHAAETASIAVAIGSV